MEKIAFPPSAAVFTAPRLAAPADTNLYGEAKVSVDDIDDSGDLIGNNRGGYWDVVNNGSKLGIKGFPPESRARVGNARHQEDLSGGQGARQRATAGLDRPPVRRADHLYPE